MAQQAGKIYRVGVLSVRGGMEERDEVFRKRLNELGYIEGKNLIVDWSFRMPSKWASQSRQTSWHVRTG
jgi:hypothetical protein